MDMLQQLAIAAALGMLVGLQREWVKDPHAGIRTYPLVTVMGVVLAALGREYGGWLPAAGLVSLAALVIMATLPVLRKDDPDVGLTGEIALLLMYSVGCLLGIGRTVESIVIAGGTMLLLHGKPRLHGFVEKIEPQELRAIGRLTLIGLVILPVLPRQDFGPDGVLNAFSIWFMVVLIVGISLVAYLVSKFIGPEKGTLAAGLLGGLISSTATTASQSRDSARQPAGSWSAAVVVIIASAVVFIRVIIEVYAAAPRQAAQVVPPLVVMLVGMGATAAILYLAGKKHFAEGGVRDVPADMKGALVFAAFYAVILVAVALAKHYTGVSGLYAVAGISGLTDMDAITLSTSRLMEVGQLAPSTGWRVILVGGLANIFFKGVLILLLASRRMKKLAWAGFGAALAFGGLLLWLWP